MMFAGFLFGVIACAIWGLVYIVPVLLPGYDPVQMSSARFAVYGLACICLIPCQINGLRKLTRSDWLLALRLSFFGNFIYYWSLTTSVQLSGAPLAGMCMAWIPVLVAVIANRRSRRLGKGVKWKQLMFPLSLIMLGMLTANWSEFTYITQGSGSEREFFLGLACAIFSLLLWTWYPLKNADWLIENPQKSPKVWATAQGICLLPFGLMTFGYYSFTHMSDTVGFFGPDPMQLLWVSLMAGILCSWVAICFWNAMSQRLPPALSGQMIVFETIFSVGYAHICRLQCPSWSMIFGMILMIGGVLAALRIFRKASSNA